MITKKKTDTFSLVSNVGSRGFYSLRWLVDNLYVLSKIGFGPKRSTAFFKVVSRQLWLMAILCYLVYCIYTVRKTYNDESDLKVAAVEFMTVKDVRDSLRKIGSIRRENTLNMIRTIADLFVCLNELRFFTIVLGLPLNDGVEGFSGILSGLIFLRQLK